MADTKYYLQSTYPLEISSSDFAEDRLVLSGDTLYNVNTPVLHRVITWVVANPTSGTTILGPKINLYGYLIYQPINVYAYVKLATNCVINIYCGAVGSTNTLLTSGLTVTTSESSTTNFEYGIYPDDWLALRIISVSGSPQQLTVSLSIYPGYNT